MTEEDIEWMRWAFEGLVTGSLWDDLTPRSLDNVFNWRNHD